jgi:DNA polymerase III epsilon subunit-like protein
MKEDDRWVVVDTETDGFHDPVHVIEIAAQVMVGWRPEGPPFRVLINHEIQMDWQAHEVHGYSAEFLREHGVAPLEAHQRFAQYVGKCPIVSHNLAFDWDRALLAEWKRLGIPAIGRRGFCSLMLSRRIIPEVEGHGLDVLKHAFSLESSVSHKAHNDVSTLVELLRTVIAPRLLKLSLDTYEMVEAFSTLDTKRAREAVKSTFGPDFVSKGSKLKSRTEPVIPDSVYHVARNGVIIGEYLMLGLYNGMRSGELNADDHYWTNGMGESWARLSDITALINSFAPKMASPQQVAYLTWLGDLNADSYTAKEASDKIQRIGGNITPREDGKNWTIERYILHPDLFRDEFQKFLSTKIKRDCLAFYDGTVFESSDYPSAEIMQVVFGALARNDLNWWYRPNFAKLFFEKLQELYPACCDGKSVYYEQELPSVLHQYVRALLVGCSEKLTKSKIREVMKVLSESDANWFRNVGFEEVFLGQLKVMYPGCCDGADRLELAQARHESRIADLQKEISEITSRNDLSNGLCVKDKLELGMMYFRLAGLLESPGDYSRSFELLTQAAHSGSISAARFMINFRPEMYGYNPPLVELRTWIAFVGKFDSHITGLSGLSQLGTPQALAILSIFDGLTPHALASLEALMTEAQIVDSDIAVCSLSKRLDEFKDDADLS